MKTASNALQVDVADSQNRRRHERRSSGIVVTILVPTEELNSDEVEEFVRFDGWTHNVSFGGFNFLCVSRIPGNEVLVQSENMSTSIAEVEIVRSREVIPGLWEHGARFLRFLSDEETSRILAVLRMTTA